MSGHEFGFEFGDAKGAGIPKPAEIYASGDAGLQEGDIVAMPCNGRGVVGFVKSVRDGYVTVVPIQQRRDGMWVKQGKTRTTHDSQLFAKVPMSITEMKVQI